MAEKKQFGMFWGNNILDIVESTATKPKNIFHISFKSEPPPITKRGAIEPWEKELASNIKRALSKNKMSGLKVNLSLPTNDIIFRSFVIPWITQNEIQNVVSYLLSFFSPSSL